MEETNRDMAGVRKDEYSFDTLLNDIQSEPTEDNKRDEAGDKAGREHKSKLIVVQMLIGLAELYKTESYKDDEKLKNAIEIIVNGNEQLSGYIFYVSQNPQFNYSWNYMRKRKENYKEFLAYSVRFLINVLDDINILARKPRAGKYMHVVFNDIIDVTLINEKPYVNTRLIWDNFYRLSKMKNEYNVSVKVKDSMLMACIRKEPSDMEKLIDSALEMIESNTLEK